MERCRSSSDPIQNCADFERGKKSGVAIPQSADTLSRRAFRGDGGSVSQRVSEDPSTVSPADPAQAAPRLWSVGTLIYTSATLGMVIFWLSLGNFGGSLR